MGKHVALCLCLLMVALSQVLILMISPCSSMSKDASKKEAVANAMAGRGGSGEDGGWWHFRCGCGSSPVGEWKCNWGVGSGPDGGSTVAFGPGSGEKDDGAGGFGYGWGGCSSTNGGTATDDTNSQTDAKGEIGVAPLTH